MSLEINKQGLSGEAINVIENATKRAEDKITAIFENLGVNYDKKNNIIDTEEEKKFFDIEINSSTILTNKEKKQILGIKEPKAPSDAKLERQEKRADRTDEKASKNYFNEVLETVVNSGVERKDIVDKLKAELTKDNADKDAEKKYNYLIKFVENALNQVKDENFEKISMQQVDEYFANLVLKTKGSTERKILRQVAQMVKNEKINAAKEDITNRYATKVEEAEKKGLKVTDKEIMDEIREELKNENKYIIDNNYGERDQNEYVTAYDAFNNGEIAQNARILLANVITGKTTDQIDGDKILKEAKQWLKKEGLWDSNVAKAKRKHRFGKNYSDYEGLTRNVALNTIKSEDELKKAFGENADEKIKTRLNKTDEKIRALMNAKVNLTDDKGQPITDAEGKPVMFNLITLREDGYYDLTNLSRYIRQQVGSDLTYNEHKHDTNSEGGYLKRGINGAIEGDEYDLSNEEILGLVEACGYDKEGQLYGTIKTILGGTVGALAHGLTAGIATLSNPSQTYLDTPPDMKDMVIETSLKNILELNEKTLKDLGLNITVETDTIIKTTISNILANEEAFIVIMPKLIAENAVKSAVMGGVLGLLAGFQAEEKPAVPLKVEQTTLKDYNDALKAGKETKKYAPLLTSLALVKDFVSEDGTLDGPGFEAYLQRLFAGNDILNKEEFAALEYEFLQTKESRHLKQKPVIENEDEHTPPTSEPKEMQGSKAQGTYNYTVDQDILVVNGIKSSWKEIARMYNDCIIPDRDSIDKDKYPNCYKRYSELEIRFVKVAQAINNGDYSLEHLLELAEATFAAKTSKYTELKDRTDIDHSALLSAMNSDWLTDVKVPKQLGECIRVKNTPADAKDMNTEGAKNAPTGYAKDTEKSYHQKDVYGLQMGNGEIETFDNMQARDERYAELVKQNQDAGYTVTTVEKLTPQEVEDAYKKKQEK